MARTDDGDRSDESQADALAAVDITIYGANERQPGEADLVIEAGDDAEMSGSRVGGARKYEEGQLPAGGSSLWWPDRNAQVVQATKVGLQQVGEFLRARVGERHERLRIDSVSAPLPSKFEAKAQLHVRPTGWRGVTLTIYPTPSANLTVIEMMPRRAWMPQTKRYLEAGVPAITELTDQIESE